VLGSKPLAVVGDRLREQAASVVYGRARGHL